jgi:hypothetical protein
MHETVTDLLRELLDALEQFEKFHSDAFSPRINKLRVRAHTFLHILDGGDRD